MESYLSGLLVYLERGTPARTVSVSADEITYLRRHIIPMLEKQFPSVVRQMSDLSDDHMLRLIMQLEPHCAEGSLFSLEWRAILLLARSACLRSVDWLAPALSSANLRYTSVVVDGVPTRVLEARMAYTKARMSSYNPIRDHVIVPRDRRHGGKLDYLPALEAYTQAVGLAIGTQEWPAPSSTGTSAVPAGPSTWLFPRYLRTSTSNERAPFENGTYRYERGLADFRFLLAKAGLDPSRYGLHSLRITGATYYLGLGLTETQVARIGLWSNPASITPYNRTHHNGDMAALAMRLGRDS